jgi:hypothetical protein
MLSKNGSSHGVVEKTVNRSGQKRAGEVEKATDNDASLTFFLQLNTG